MISGWKYAVSCFVAALLSVSAMAWSPETNNLNPSLVERFYAANQQKPFWFTADPLAPVIRKQFIDAIDNASYYGLDKGRYHYSALKNEPEKTDSSAIITQDRLFTDAVLTFCKDIYQGNNIVSWLKNDEISGKYSETDNAFIVNKLLAVHSPADAESLQASLEPQYEEYRQLKQELQKQISANSQHHIRQLNVSINFYRWLNHFNFDKFVVVNIPAEKLRYYEKDNVELQMKVVVGKPKTKTPRFSTYCKRVILYPYWYVPPSIAIKELIPKFQEDPSAIERMNLEVVDKRDNVVSSNSWAAVSSGNYTFRQGTGCDNALGVIKFELTDPFNVYMHDTNAKLAFQKESRALSHGCIRLEKPLELANILLNNRVDEDFVRACIKGQKPRYLSLDQPLPVFVVYMPAQVEHGKVVYHSDTYELL
jgi:murein L,D-transpeptidase YcbB/YkuD